MKQERNLSVIEKKIPPLEAVRKRFKKASAWLIST